jgi:hypothetical protein
MSDSAFHDALVNYAAAIRADRRANPTMTGEGTALELLLAPRFQVLLETLLSTTFGKGNPGPRVLPEYRKGGIGRPDIALARAGLPARSFVELKEPGKTLDRRRLRGHDAAQFDRFNELPLWGFSNFHTIHLYKFGTPIETAVMLPAATLEPDAADATSERAIRRTDTAGLRAIVEALALAQPVAPRNAKELAELLARAARLSRAVVLDACRAGAPPVLDAVRAEFRETLFAHPEAAGHDTSDEDMLFAGAFAQTLAFGLLLAREASGAEVGQDAYRRLPEGTFPLLRATLRALTQDEIVDLLAAAYDVLRDTVNVVDPALLAATDTHDPILYFYEDFLTIFDAAARRKHGVFYTPVPVVRFMVAATDRALRAASTNGLRDPQVRLLDPACGTGTFLIAAASHTAARVAAEDGPDAVPIEIADLATRLAGLELLVGPYTVAHYRLQREYLARGATLTHRLPIFLADTLAPPAQDKAITAHLGFMSAPMVAERASADELKGRTPILAIIGNPPYRRLAEGEEASITAGWDNGFWDDLKQPVRNAGWGGELNTFPDLYIAFWRWCLWKLFDAEGAPGRGVVCLITNRTFLAGHPYAGLRQMLRARFDRIEIVDLRGDSRGARPAGIAEDENVFAIQAGVCVLTAVASGNKSAGTPADVRLADVWRHDAFTAMAKQALLGQAETDPGALRFVPITRGDLDDFSPAPYAGRDWPSLAATFAYRKSGTKTQRDDLVYAFEPGALSAKLESFLSGSDEAARGMFFPGRERQDRAEQARYGRARQHVLATQRNEQRGYRPMDRRWLYSHPDFISREGPELGLAWGAENVCLYAMPSGTGAGPAVWVHGQKPDYHSFRGSYGGYAFPLFDRRQGPQAHNLDPALLDGLADAYAQDVSPQEVFDAIAALLSAPSYTHRFAADLEEAFPHIPFPADATVFAEAARIGAEIRGLETFARPAAGAFRTARIVGTAPAGACLAIPSLSEAFVSAGDAGRIALVAGGGLALDQVPSAAWHFAVSGYRVLYRWLAARNGEAWNATLQRGALDLVNRLTELLHWFTLADAVLVQAVATPLTRTRLGL